jgi:hypothetical protein
MITLGQETALSDHVVLGVLYVNAFSWLVAFMGIGLSVVSFALFMTQRTQKEHLWLALQGLAWCIGLPIGITESFRNLPVAFAYLDLPFGMLGDFFKFLMIFAFVRLKFRGWLRTYIVLSCFCVVAVKWVGLSGVSLPPRFIS